MWASENAHQSQKASGVVVDVPGENGLDFDLAPADVRRRWTAGVDAARSANLPGGL
jgi:hypothetical protein